MAPMASSPGRHAPETVVIQTALLVVAMVCAVGILGSALAIAWRSASQSSRG